MNFEIKAILALFFVFSLSSVSAQNTFPISDEGTVEESNCDNTVFITDSNADDGNYLPGEAYEMTVCLNTLADNPIQITIIPQINGNDTINLWDVDEFSTLQIFEGIDTDGNLLGTFNSVSHPDGVFFLADTECVTLVWNSSENSSGEGFVAQLTCHEELQPFVVAVSIDPPFGLSTDTFPDIGPNENVITFCFGDTLSFTANPSFPLSNAEGDGYEQLGEECIFTWDMGNGDVFEDVGLNELTYSYPEPGGYLATLIVTDVMGQMELYDAYLLMAPRPKFSNIVFGDTLCLGDTTIITGGILFPDTVGVSPTQSTVQPNYDFTESRYLPDGSGELYQTVVNIDGYLNSPVIFDPGDFIGICINMEHSYLGDLEAWLTCPNGQTAMLFDGFAGAGLDPDGEDGFPGAGSTFLGDAFDNNIMNEGIGFDYCFSDNGPLGTMAQEFAAGNTVPVSTFATGNAMVEGTYLPQQDFETAFAGCPLNGDWTLNIADNLSTDDGYIFEWSMEFNPEFELDTIYYQPDILDAYWLDDEDIVFNSDTSVTIVPSQEGNNAFTFVVEDSFGCIHDTTFQVYVRPLPILSTVPACFLLDSLNPVTATQGGVYNALTFPTETATLEIEDEADEFGWSQIMADEFGLYTVEFIEQLCGVDQGVPAYRDTVLLDFRPVPQIEPFFEDTTLCGGASIVYDAGPQEANSGNFLINWTQDGNTYNAEDYSTTVSTSGLIVLTITEPAGCGSASDTSRVTAIEVNFEGDTICGLIPRFRAVEVMPESIGGSWSANDDGVIFSMPNSVVTEIIAPEFGDYVITYTDVRCPADAVSRDFKWYEQPDLTITPTNPNICYELDTLNLTAVLQGAGNGTYFWELSAFESEGGTPPLDTDLDENQSFPPESFDPEVNYVATVFTFDEFLKCPEPGRDTLIFKPIACVYGVPNVITPNGDGLNDLFVIENVEDFPDASLAILNRWGQEVFSSNSYDQYQAQKGGWDPEDLPGGVYFIELKLPSIDVIETGNLTIITEQGSEQ